MAWRATHRLKALLQPSPLEAEERSLRSRHLQTAIGLTIPILVLGVLVTWAYAGGPTLSIAFAIPPTVVALLLARRGHLQRASFVLMATILGLSHWLLYVGDGLQDLALLHYPILMLMGSLLLESAGYTALVSLGIASLCAISLGQAEGSVRLLDPGDRELIPQRLILAVVIIVGAAVISRVLVMDLRRHVRRARRHERALEESEKRYRLISEVISDYTFSSIVEPDGRVRTVWVAGAFERILGWTFDEYQSRGDWPAALPPDDRGEDEGALEVLRSNRRVTTELRIVTKSGDVRWVRVYAHPVWSEDEDRLAGIYGAVQDITDSRRAKAEREKLIRDLEATNAELERFTYTASHELRTPLVTVGGFVNLLERDAAAGNLEDVADHAARVQRAIERMRRLLDELLGLSRVGRVVNEPGPVDLGELVGEAVDLNAERIARHGVTVRVGDELPAVWGDRPRLLQVVQNLVDNAVKFASGQAAPEVVITAQRQNGAVLLEVADNGIGIEPRYLERVFGLFDKLDPKSEGTGVGLALVRRIVEFHGGHVWAHSEGRGRGATFSVLLPGAKLTRRSGSAS